MIFLFLSSFAFSEIGNYTIKPTSTLLFFSSFGFTDNSNFSFSIHSTLPAKLNIFLLSNSEIRNSASRHIYKTCHSQKIRISNLNKTFNISRQNFFWSGTVENQDVYFPVILICSENISYLNVLYHYRNKDSLIDFRNVKNSTFYLFFSLANILLGLIWLINTLFKNNFSIPLQQLIVFLPIFKAISNSLTASQWETRKFTDEISQTKKFLSVLFSTLFYISFMYSTTLIFSGWCIFRMNLTLIEKVQIFISSFFVVFGFYFDDFFNGYISSLIPILFISAGFLWYMKINATYLATLVQLSESNIENNRMKSRILLVQHFSVATFIVLIIDVLLQSGIVSFDLWPIVGSSIHEAGMIFLEVVEIYFFFLRDTFAGEIDLTAKQSFYPFLLIEPTRKEIAFVSQENEEKCSL